MSVATNSLGKPMRGEWMPGFGGHKPICAHQPLTMDIMKKETAHLRTGDQLDVVIAKQRQNRMTQSTVAFKIEGHPALSQGGEFRRSMYGMPGYGGHKPYGWRFEKKGL
eukprot:TRINITY_DN115536_c0_g1_i1.p1 TRINITY_DN115536_c0_g1~~TRINITY_DN115536_c0_g1_i1.p1  ORF type:complete len:109 (+),score=19.66 TRINITY_DN115536_c0_g1_i1:78-404(+)